MACWRCRKLLLFLVLSLQVLKAFSNCTQDNENLTVQLSRADVLRTWQPSGAHCRWWESRQSETNRFPAAVRSGPRWLVMQLRQPMMLEAVSVRDWDGQWHTAAPVGSPVSAVGASSLPLELQLEDPCDASWEAFNSSSRWKQLGRAYKELNSQTQPAVFELRATSAMHDATLSCFLTDRPAERIEQTIGISFPPASLTISVSPVWVSGSSVTVNVTSAPAYPALHHSCSISSASSEWRLDENRTNVKKAVAKDDKNQAFVVVASQFRFQVSAAMLNGTLECESGLGVQVEDNVAVQRNEHYFISAISEPCVTVIHLISTQHRWLTVRVTSQQCSVWNVSHNCWLTEVGGGAAARIRLKMSSAQQTGFSSSHWARLPEGQESRDWLVRCSVSQSGLPYPDVEAKFSTGRKSSANAKRIFVSIFLLAVAVSAIGLGCKLAVRFSRVRTTSSLYSYDQSNDDELGSETDCTVSTAASGAFHQNLPASPFLVTVAAIDDAEEDTEPESLSSSDEECWTEAAGHYDLDGSNFVYYR
uniref:Ig-like domain-containing protein n=1 Tax=Macrostomum lignano TaxID=282301 RepID=A0A1I8J952_9PLAT